MRASQYNFAIPAEEGLCLYNALSGAAMLLEGNACESVADLLTGTDERLSPDRFEPGLWSEMESLGFLTESWRKELELVGSRFRDARGATPMVLTLTTTLDCNLGCYYCYEERSVQHLELADVDRIVTMTRDRLRKYAKRSLHVDWYGGEPLLNPDFVEAASEALQKMCHEEKAGYEASIISNGTSWPEDVAEFIRRHRIVQAQISFDGLGRNHNVRRRFRKGYEPQNSASSFEMCVALVDKLVQVVRVDVRLNVDRGNKDDFIPFISMARERGWFNAPYPVVVQPARLSNYSERSEFMRHKQLRPEEFERVRRGIAASIDGDVAMEDGRMPDGLPHPRTSVCAALTDASVVVGADANLFRCGLQVSEPNRSVGVVAQKPGLKMLPIAGKPTDERWWEAYDPTQLPKCSKCSFLPLCWGGCPKRHLEGDSEGSAQQGLFWRTTLPSLVGNLLEVSVADGYHISTGAQFRVSPM